MTLLCSFLPSGFPTFRLPYILAFLHSLLPTFGFPTFRLPYFLASLPSGFPTFLPSSEFILIKKRRPKLNYGLVSRLSGSVQSVETVFRIWFRLSVLRCSLRFLGVGKACSEHPVQGGQLFVMSKRAGQLHNTPSQVLILPSDEPSFHPGKKH